MAAQGLTVLATPSQQRGLMVLLGILIAIFAIRLAFNFKTIGDFKPDEPPASPGLADHLDPNTASQAELAAIPDLGEKRAEAIVNFRDRYKIRHPGQPAFKRLSDLEQISGIGAATAENMESYLVFPKGTATTK